jgi:hypothetical protein
MTGIRCYFPDCTREIDPTDPTNYRVMIAFEPPIKRQRASGSKGGSDLEGRTPTGQLAHAVCVRSRRVGVHVDQQQLV